MDTYIVAHDLAPEQMPFIRQYADGVFIRLTGGRVYDFQPEAKRAGWLDASIMNRTELAGWLAFCVEVLGYVAPSGTGAGHVC